MGRELAAGMDELAQECRRHTLTAFESADYQGRVEEGMKDVQERHRQITQ